MSIAIKTYRGFDILYNEETDKFECSLTSDGGTAAKMNLSGLQKYIDEHIKENQVFESFKAFRLNGYSDLPDAFIEVTGIRKDRKFVGLDSNGKAIAVGVYDEKCYYRYDKRNEVVFAKIASIMADIDNLRTQVKEAKKDLVLTPIKELKP
jgi:hypothetical protein